MTGSSDNRLDIPAGTVAEIVVARGCGSLPGAADSLPGHITVGKGASLKIIAVMLPSSDESLDTEITLAAEDASCEIYGTTLAGGDSRCSIGIVMRHSCGKCFSRQMFRTAASGKASCTFSGKIIVDQDAQKTEAYQEHHSLLLSDGACVGTMPQLEIYADDVKCSHGATIGKLDPDQLFYLRSRGIPESRARQLQIRAFLHPAIGNISDIALRDALAGAVDKMLITF